MSAVVTETKVDYITVSAPSLPAAVDVWTLLSGSDIQRISGVSAGGGASANKPAFHAAYPARTASQLLPASGSILNVVSSDTDVQIQRSTDNGATFTTVLTITGAASISARRDPTHSNSLWVLVVYATNATLLTDQILGRSGVFNNANIVGILTDFKADTGDITLLYSADGGATWNNVLLDYLNQLWATQITGGYGTIPYPNPPHDPDPPFSGQTFPIGILARADFSDYGPGADVTGWTTLFTTDDHWAGIWEGWDCRLGGGAVGPDSTGAPTQEALGYWLYDATNVAGNTVLHGPTYAILLAPDGTGAYVYAFVAGSELASSQTQDYGGITTNLVLNPMLQGGHFTLFGTASSDQANRFVKLYRVHITDGSASSRTLLASDFASSPDATLQEVCADALNSDAIYLVADTHELTKYHFASDSYSGSPIDLDAAMDGNSFIRLFCTRTGTLIAAAISGDAEHTYIYRSVNGGATWTQICEYLDFGVDTINSATINTFYVAESAGVLVVPINDDDPTDPGAGKYLFSVDDGLTWQITAVLAAQQLSSPWPRDVDNQGR